MTTWYSVSSWSTLVEPVTVTRETDKFVYVERRSSHNGAMCSRLESKAEIFPTFAQAKEFLVAKALADIARHELAIKCSRKELEKAQALSEPKE